jgi:hypothetical protein
MMNIQHLPKETGMKTHYSVLPLFLLLVACNNPGKDTENAVAETPAAEAQEEAPAAESAAEESAGFSKSLALQGIEFNVEATNQGSINQLAITPSGLKEENSVISREIDGSVTGVDVADLNSDGSPEIYVFINSAGSGSYGSLVAYSVNNMKSMSEIYLPPIADDPINSKGYMGHDEFAIIENTFAQRFPLYNDGDSNANPTGKMRQLNYKLKQGEAGWVLKLDNVEEF